MHAFSTGLPLAAAGCDRYVQMFALSCHLFGVDVSLKQNLCSNGAFYIQQTYAYSRLQ
jgi:hypothetical protein